MIDRPVERDEQIIRTAEMVPVGDVIEEGLRIPIPVLKGWIKLPMELKK